MWEVAISYARDDYNNYPVIKFIIERLKAEDYNVFIDTHNEEDLIGKSYSSVFSREFGEKAKKCIVFISKRYLEREYTLFEFLVILYRNIKEKGNFLIPICLDSTEIIDVIKKVRSNIENGSYSYDSQKRSNLTTENIDLSLLRLNKEHISKQANINGLPEILINNFHCLKVNNFKQDELFYKIVHRIGEPKIAFASIGSFISLLVLYYVYFSHLKHYENSHIDFIVSIIKQPHHTGEGLFDYYVYPFRGIVFFIIVNVLIIVFSFYISLKPLPTTNHSWKYLPLVIQMLNSNITIYLIFQGYCTILYVWGTLIVLSYLYWLASGDIHKLFVKKIYLDILVFIIIILCGLFSSFVLFYHPHYNWLAEYLAIRDGLMSSIVWGLIFSLFPLIVTFLKNHLDG